MHQNFYSELSPVSDKLNNNRITVKKSILSNKSAITTAYFINAVNIKFDAFCCIALNFDFALRT